MRCTKFVLYLCIFLSGSFISGPELFSFEIYNSAHQMKDGGLTFSVFGSAARRDIGFSVTQRGWLTVRDERGNERTFYTATVGRIDAVSSDEKLAVKANIALPNRWYPWAKIAVGPSSLEVKDIVGTNEYESAISLDAALGVRKNLLPDTIVTPAVAVDAGVGYYRSVYRNLKLADGSPQGHDVEVNLSSWIYQMSFIISKRFSEFEPYGAVKVSRTWSELKDEKTSSAVSGSKDGVGLTLGLRYNVAKNVSPAIELGFLNDRYISAGVTLEF